MNDSPQQTLRLDSPEIGVTPPINRLASEILIAIFESIVDEDGEIRTSDIVFVSHVCDLWRRVSLATPSLWTSLNARSRSFQTFATRSYPLPINFTLIEDRQAEEQGVVPLFLIQAHLDRAKSITVIGSSSLIAALFDNPLPPLHLPTLKRLKLGCNRFYNEIPSFQHHVPNLQQLDLVAVGMKLEGLSLTSFSLASMAPEFNDCPSSWDIVQLFQRSPSMRRVHLEAPGILPATIPVGPFRDSVELGELESFKIDALATPDAYFPFLKIPSRAPLITRSSALYIMKKHEAHGLTFKGAEGQRTPLFITGKSLTISGFLEMTNVILSSFDIRSIPFLAVHIEDDEPAALATQWSVILSRMPALSQLFITGYPALIRTILLALSPDAKVIDNQHQYLPCPGLKILHVTKSSPTSPHQPLGPFLAQCLASRARVTKTPLDTLIVNFGEELLENDIGAWVRVCVQR